MNPSQGAFSVSSLQVEVLDHGPATTISLRGRADGTNLDPLPERLARARPHGRDGGEIGLAELESCDVETILELVAFASEVRDHDGQVSLAGATPWTVAMLKLLDVEGVIALPAAGPDPSTGTWLSSDLSPAQVTALRRLLAALDHERDVRDVDGSAAAHQATSLVVEVERAGRAAEGWSVQQPDGDGTGDRDRR